MKGLYAGGLFIALGFAMVLYGAIGREPSYMGAGALLLATGAVLMVAGVRSRRNG